MSPAKKYKKCLCGRGGNQFQIACDGCDRWYHGSCVNVKPKEADGLDQWYCELCSSFAQMKEQFNAEIAALHKRFDDHQLVCRREPQQGIETEDLKSRLQRAIEEKEELLTRIREFEEKVKQISVFQLEVESLNLRLKRTDEEKEKLLNKLKEYEEQVKQISAIQSEVDSLKTSLQRADEEKENLLKRIQESESMNKENPVAHDHSFCCSQVESPNLSLQSSNEEKAKLRAGFDSLRRRSRLSLSKRT